MTEKYYGIYFDKFDLKVNEDGELINPEVLYIMEFEYDENISDEPIDIRRIDEKGNLIEEYPDLSDLDYAGYDDDPCVSEALDRFYEWLQGNLVWKQTSRQTYWQPAEYTCVGIEGCM